MFIDLPTSAAEMHPTLSKSVVEHRAKESAVLTVKLTRIMQAAEAALPDADLGFNEPLGFGLLHHALYQAATAARERDPSRIDDLITLVGTMSSTPQDRSVLCVAPASLCRQVDDKRFGSPVQAMTAAAVEGTAAPTPLLDHMVCLLDDADLLGWVREGASCLVLCDKLAGAEGDGAFSYSVGILPHTVFTDWCDNAAVLGECLLHEAGHCWLNMALATADERLPPETIGYSPWKDTDRPAFAMIHSGFAFGLVCAFLEVHVDTLSLTDQQRRYCEVRSQVERSRLRKARPAIEKSLALLRNEHIAELVARLAFATP